MIFSRDWKPGEVVFEKDMEVQQTEDVYQLLMGQTMVNQRFIGKTIHSSEVVNDVHTGKLTELKLTFTDGKWVRIMCGDDNNLVMEEG